MCGQYGSANGWWTTTPSPKNVRSRFFVRSKIWSGTTSVWGGRSSLRLPTAF